MTYAIDRAIQSGYDSACNYGKDGDSPYHDRHPLFQFWWGAVVLKADRRDLNLSQVRREVISRVRPK